jgi:hypothetical protein
MKFLKAAVDFLLIILRAVLYEWVLFLLALVRLICAHVRKWRGEAQLPDRLGRGARNRCVQISDPAYKRPDPLIYSQPYLMEQGLAVTWDNPDIQLFRQGTQVPSSPLVPDTDYEVVARIWNNSTEAPAVALPVSISFLSFGVGTTSTHVADTTVDLGVKGGPDHPAFAKVNWRTPATPGHFCLQVHLDWLDDLNPKNNLGQENTNVMQAASPAVGTFQLRNNSRTRQQYRFVVDAHSLGRQPPCTQREMLTSPATHGWRREAPGTVTTVPAGHVVGSHPLPPGWTARLDPAEPLLSPAEEITVTATIEPPDGWAGRQAINVNAFADAGLAGGVTWYVERA